VQPRDNPT